MESTTTVRAQVLQLPATAPLVRITAGMGTVAQKTWNLRRPVTLLGSRRPAHIVLHDKNISDAHCVIVNTGTEIILKDLHTEGGTLRNDVRIDLTVLGDGDVVQLGETKIQIAIQTPHNPNVSDWNNALSEVLSNFVPPCTYKLEGGDQSWEICDPVVLLGKHQDASIQLDHPDVSTRHAVIFRFCEAPAAFDLGSRYGLHVNGQRCSLTSLHHGDTIKVGPFGLQLGRIANDSEEEFIERHHEGELIIEPPLVKHPAASQRRKGISSEVLSHDLSSSWTGLNTWEAMSRPSDPQNHGEQSSLAEWEEELEKKEAALRGKLHDLERYNELIESRERDIITLAERNKQESQRLIDEREDLGRKTAELEKKEGDLRRRETAVAQRWARMKAMSSTQCETPSQSPSPDASNARLN